MCAQKLVAEPGEIFQLKIKFNLGETCVNGGNAHLKIHSPFRLGSLLKRFPKHGK